MTNKPNSPATDAAQAAQAENTSKSTIRKMLMILPVLVAAILCYSVTVFAWFQDSLTNSGNIIRTGQFTATVELTRENDVIWSSKNDTPEGILGCEASIPLSSGKVTLTITNNTDSSLAFQYALLLTENSKGGAAIAIGEGKLYNAEGEQVDKPSNPPFLEPGWRAVYTFDVTVNTVYLQFCTAFQNNTTPTFTTILNAQNAHRGPTSTQASTSTSASAPTETTGTTTTVSGLTSGTVTGSAAADSTTTAPAETTAAVDTDATDTPGTDSTADTTASEGTDTTMAPTGTTAA